VNVREPFGSFLWKFTKTLATGTLPGLIAGFFAFGLGSRIAMRVMAVTSGPGVQGAKTEAEEIVGKITLDGTMFLILAGTFIGGVAGLIYIAIKPWLPEQRGLRQLTFSLVMLAIVGRMLVDSDNIDFEILSPAILAVAMFAALPLLYGYLFVSLHDRLAPFVMRERSWWTAAALLIPSLLPLLIGGPFSLVLVPMALLVGWIASGWSPIGENGTVMQVGRGLLVAGTVVGLAFFVLSGATIL